MKPHRFKSIDDAVRRIRELERIVSTQNRLLDEFAQGRLLMARLAADTPQFSNPLDVYEAKKLRDEILNNEITNRAH